MVAFASLSSVTESEPIGRRRELVAMDDYLAALSDAIDRTFSDRVTIVPLVQPGGRLDHRRAECVGLFVSVAAVNALKHAFPDGAGGKIEVRFRRLRDAFELRVSDDGVGFDPFAARPGRGMELMKELAAQLDGSLRFENAPGGASVRLSFAACGQSDQSCDG